MTRRRKSTLPQQLAGYRKALVALIGAVGTWGVAASPDGITGTEWWGLLVAVATGLGVSQVVNATADESTAD